MTAVCVTHIGKRVNHEDNYLFDGDYLTEDIQNKMSDGRLICMSSTNTNQVQIYAVSDGMGGHNGGEVASRICVEKLASLKDRLYIYDSINDIVNLVQLSIAEINLSVCEKSNADNKLKDMGATLVVLVICGSDCAILNIGDSRAYYFKHNALTQITKDHTEGQRILDLGLLTKKEVEDFPARKSLNRYVGYNQKGYTLKADEYYLKLNGGRFLLCSDGITDSLSDEQIINILNSESELLTIGKNLIEQSVVFEYADNSTVILVDLEG